MLRIRAALGYTLATGFVFAPFVAYLSSAQQIFREAYDTGVLFPVYFGALALAVGVALLVNGRLVMRHGMRRLSKFASGSATLISLVGWAGVFAFDGLPPLWLFMAWLMAVFLCVGLLFGNLNALAMEPLGHIAGVGAAVVASLSTFISVPLGMLVGQSFDGTMYALVGSFAIFGAADARRHVVGRRRGGRRYRPHGLIRRPSQPNRISGPSPADGPPRSMRGTTLAGRPERRFSRRTAS